MSKFALFSGSDLKKRKVDKKQTYMKTETCKLYSRDFWIFLPNTIKIDPYDFKLYRFKVGPFLRQCISNRIVSYRINNCDSRYPLSASIVDVHAANLLFATADGDDVSRVKDLIVVNTRTFIGLHARALFHSTTPNTSQCLSVAKTDKTRHKSADH